MLLREDNVFSCVSLYVSLFKESPHVTTVDLYICWNLFTWWSPFVPSTGIPQPDRFKLVHYVDQTVGKGATGFWLEGLLVGVYWLRSVDRNYNSMLIVSLCQNGILFNVKLMDSSVTWPLAVPIPYQWSGVISKALSLQWTQIGQSHSNLQITGDLLLRWRWLVGQKSLLKSNSILSSVKSLLLDTNDHCSKGSLFSCQTYFTKVAKSSLLPIFSANGNLRAAWELDLFAWWGLGM